MEENKRSGMEELKSINRKYLIIKRALEDAKNTVQEKEKLLEEQNEELKLAEGIIVLGKRQNNKVKIQEAEKEKAVAKKKIEKIQKELKELKEDIVELNSEMKEIINSLKEKPELRQHIENCLEKKYKREISKSIKEKEELIKEQEKLIKEKEKTSKKVEKIEKLKELVKDHPHFKNNLTGLLQAKIDIEALKSKLSKLDLNVSSNIAERVKIKIEIEDKENKANRNKDLLMQYLKKRKIDISEKDIEELEGTIVKENGIIDINKTLNKNLKENKSKVEEYEKNIKSYEEKIKKKDKKIRIDEKSITHIQQQTEPLPLVNVAEPPIAIEPKLKWYQFFARAKRFISNWGKSYDEVIAMKEEREKEIAENIARMSRRGQEEQQQQPQLQEQQVPQQQQEQQVPPQVQPENKNDFYNSLKYEVVGDMMKIVSKENMRNAEKAIKAERRANAQTESVQNSETENSQNPETARQDEGAR